MEERFYREFDVPEGDISSVENLNKKVEDLVHKNYSEKPAFKITTQNESGERKIMISNNHYIVELNSIWGPDRRYSGAVAEEFYAYSISAETTVPLITQYDKRHGNFMIYAQFAGVALLISIYALLVMLTGIAVFSTHIVTGVIFGGFALGRGCGKIIRSISAGKLMRKIERNSEICGAFEEWRMLKEGLESLKI